jgi:hypothetical protein
MSTSLSENDIVLIHYNNQLGRIVKVQNNLDGSRILYDIEGLSGHIYPNQYDTEITKINGLEHIDFSKLMVWIRQNE